MALLKKLQHMVANGTKSGHDALVQSLMEIAMQHPASLGLLRSARAMYTQKQLAEILEVDVRTIRRWEVRENEPPAYLSDAIRQRILPLVGGAENDTAAFRFIDLFAGIGGIRLGFEARGGQCVFTSEWNKFSQQTYLANFPESSNHVFIDDIRTGVLYD